VERRVSALVKICGVTEPADAYVAGELGVDYLGLNFWPRSKRYLPFAQAPAIAACARQASEGYTKLVGVFVNPSLDDLWRAYEAAEIEVVQLHGDEPLDLVAELAVELAKEGVQIWKAVAAADEAAVERLDEWKAAAILLDAPSAGRGGSGLTIDEAVVLHAKRRHPELRLVLAGGMRPDNVAAAVARMQPWAVDTASGVEAAPGKKDAAKMAAFVRAVREPTA
jgi:phosphoribosylanthranilate isomerase